MEIWTLTVDDGDGIHTSVHRTENDALTTVFINYDDEAEYGADGCWDLQGLMDASGLVVYIERHTLGEE